MGKGIGIAGLTIGLILIVIGTGGFGMLFAVSGSLFKEDFNAFNWSVAWGSGTYTINPAGQLQFSSSQRCDLQTTGFSSSSVPTGFQAELVMRVDTWATSLHSFVMVKVEYSGYTHALVIERSAVRVSVEGPALEWKPCTTSAGTWYTWLWTVNTATGVQTVSRTGFSGSWSAMRTAAPSSNIIQIDQSDSNGTWSGTQTIHVDRLYMDALGGSPPQEYGSIKFTAKLDGVLCDGWSVSGGGKSGSCPSGQPSTGVTLTDIPIGTYTFTATKTSPSLTATWLGTIAVGTNSPVTFDFTSGDGDQNETDYWALIMNFLKNTTVKAIFTASGAGLCVLSGIVLIVSLRKKTPKYQYF